MSEKPTSSQLSHRMANFITVTIFLLGASLFLTSMFHLDNKEHALWHAAQLLGEFLMLIVALHFIHEYLTRHLMGIETRELTSNLIEHHLTKFSTSLPDLLRATTAKGSATFYPTTEQVLLAIVTTIERLDRSNKERKEIMFSPLHGHGSGRRAPLPELAGRREHFFRTMSRCIRSSGEGMWHVYELISITDLERLDMVLKRVRSFENSVGYDVRARCSGWCPA